MHLAIVTPFPPSVTGIGQYGYYISGALARSGIFKRITILTESTHTNPFAVKALDPWEHEPGIQVERIWQPGRVDVCGRILTRLSQLKPDLVWYNLGASSFGRSPLANLSGLFSPVLSRQTGMPSVATLHEVAAQADLQRLDAPGGRLAYLGACWITLTSSQVDVVCVTLRRHFNWLRVRWPAKRVVHIPHGSFDRPQMLDEAQGQELLIFTTHAPFKGLELLLSAFKELHACNPGLRLTIAGTEHPRFPGYLKRAQDDFGEHTAVRWLGCVPEPELRDLFGRAAIVVLPYTATTGSSSVLYRAASWGRPIVSSDLPELRAVVEEAGLQVEFFPSGDRAALVTSLASLLSRPDQRQAQIRHNLNAVAHMTLAETSQAYLRAFDMALAVHDRRLKRPVPIHRQQESL
jgi:glycosyltransferase involved in cell wall biosynthesis